MSRECDVSPQYVSAAAVASDARRLVEDDKSGVSTTAEIRPLYNRLARNSKQRKTQRRRRRKNSENKIDPRKYSLCNSFVKQRNSKAY